MSFSYKLAIIICDQFCENLPHIRTLWQRTLFFHASMDSTTNKLITSSRPLPKVDGSALANVCF